MQASTSCSERVRIVVLHNMIWCLMVCPILLMLTCFRSCIAVVEGMDIILQIEGLGTGSGKPKKKITIADSGELK